MFIQVQIYLFRKTWIQFYYFSIFISSDWGKFSFRERVQKKRFNVNIHYCLIITHSERRLKRNFDSMTSFLWSCGFIFVVNTLCFILVDVAIRHNQICFKKTWWCHCCQAKCQQDLSSFLQEPNLAISIGRPSISLETDRLSDTWINYSIISNSIMVSQTEPARPARFADKTVVVTGTIFWTTWKRRILCFEWNFPSNWSLKIKSSSQEPHLESA